MKKHLESTPVALLLMLLTAVMLVLAFASCQKFEVDQLGKDGWLGEYKYQSCWVSRKGYENTIPASITITNWPKCTLGASALNTMLKQPVTLRVGSSSAVIASSVGFDPRFNGGNIYRKDLKTISVEYDFTTDSERVGFKIVYQK